MSLPHNLTKKDIVICALLGAFCLYLFKDIVVGGHRLVGLDFTGFYLGMKKFLFDEIHLYHSIPFWNPYIFSGMPFWAHFESTIFYPLGFLFWIISPDKAYGYTMFLHLTLAAVFMYILSRSFRIGRAGSFVAAAVFTCNGFVMALLYLGHMCPIQSYIWLPLVIYFLNRSLTSRTPFFNATVAGVLWGVQILAGAPQDAFYTFLAGMLFLVWNIRLDQTGGRHALQLLATALILFVTGAGVASIQIIPAFELIGESVRASLDSFKSVTLASYPPEGIITTVLPHFFGNYAKEGFWVGNVPWSIPQQNLYVGILPLVSLLFLSYRDTDNRKIIIFAGSLAIIAFILALGRHTPIYKLAYLLPGFDRFRAPSKIIVLWVFGLGLLAGKGMDGLLKKRENNLIWRPAFFVLLMTSLVALDILFHFDNSSALRFFSPFVLKDAIPGDMGRAAEIIAGEFHRLVLFFSFIIVVVLFLTRSILQVKYGAVFLCALLLVDLAWVNAKTVKHDDQFYLSLEKIKWDMDRTIGRDITKFRIGSYRFGPGPNLEMYLGYETVGGFTALFPGRYYEYLTRYANGKIPEGWVLFSYGRNKNSKMMDLLNVKYEVHHATRSSFLRKTFLPRAFIVPGHKIVPKQEVLNNITGVDFDPTRTVLFEKGEPAPHTPAHSLPKSPATGQARIIKYRPDHTIIVTDSDAPGYLFLGEIFYPGWKALLDDKPVPILRGNYLFRVIELPEGKHTVRFVFDPLSIKIGIGITVFTMFMLLNVLIYHYRKRSKVPPVPL